MVDIYCSICNIFITKEEKEPTEKVVCGVCMVNILSSKLVLAKNLAKAVRNSYREWEMPDGVKRALQNFEEAIKE